MISTFWFVAGLVLLFYLYIRHNDKRLLGVPSRALAVSPERWTAHGILQTAQSLAEKPIYARDRLPPQTGRRYIVVGGVSEPSLGMCTVSGG
jgi:hypothetical protein